MRQLADGQEQVELQAATVGEAVEALCQRYDRLRDRLCKPSGKLRGSITIFVNNAQPAATQDTALNDGDTVAVLVPVGGG